MFAYTYIVYVHIYVFLRTHTHTTHMEHNCLQFYLDHSSSILDPISQIQSTSCVLCSAMNLINILFAFVKAQRVQDCSA